MKRILSILFAAVLFASCGKDLPVLNGIDSQQWKDDHRACGGYRKSVEGTLRMELEKLKGLSEMDIIKLLGKPDQNELYKRNQKFYSYDIYPGTGCSSPDSISHKLILRFTAMGYAQLVSIE